jgi:hypothetical protein
VTLVTNLDHTPSLTDTLWQVMSMLNSTIFDCLIYKVNAVPLVCLTGYVGDCVIFVQGLWRSRGGTSTRARAAHGRTRICT